MVLRGLQKTTLLDFPGHVACTVFTGGCNLRCPFCHNGSLLRAEGGEVLPTEEFFSFLSKRRGLLEGVCVTGGEPLLQPDIAPFLRRIREMGYLVKLDTNGTRPDVLDGLLSEGLVDYVAMDIKNSKEKYLASSGVSQNILPDIEKSIALLREERVPYEFRTTLVYGMQTEEDMKEIGAWLKGVPRYFLQGYTDSPDVLTEGLSGYTKEETEKLLAAVLPFIPNAKIRGM